MNYSINSNNCCYSARESKRLDQVVNKFYTNITVNNINNGIQHSIAAQRTGDINVYNQTIDQRVQNNYVVNLDQRKVEFISPYVGKESVKRDTGYKITTDYEILTPEYESMITKGMLASNRPLTRFVADAKDIEPLVFETFEKMTGQELPDDIVIRVCSEEELKKAHTNFGGQWVPGIMGFAINRTQNPSLVFVRNNDLDALMLTVGHELGHVVSNKLGSCQDEEAKAFAFQIAWVNTIVDNDIGGLSSSFDVDFMPAANGLHDRAFSFVQKKVKSGVEALKVFWQIASGSLRTNAT